VWEKGECSRREGVGEESVVEGRVWEKEGMGEVGMGEGWCRREGEGVEEGSVGVKREVWVWERGASRRKEEVGCEKGV
jgi:hypothetical protein